MYTKKYELVPEGNLFRIRAVKDFNDVKKYDTGELDYLKEIDEIDIGDLICIEKDVKEDK